MSDDSFSWLDRNRAEIAAYEKARAERERMRGILAVVMVGIGLLSVASVLIHAVFEDGRVWCLPYEIPLEQQSERGLRTVEVGKLFSPAPGIEHSFWCYQKD